MLTDNDQKLKNKLIVANSRRLPPGNMLKKINKLQAGLWNFFLRRRKEGREGGRVEEKEGGMEEGKEGKAMT